MTELKDKELSNVTGGLLDEYDDNYSIVVNSYTCPKQEVVKVLTNSTKNSPTSISRR